MQTLLDVILPVFLVIGFGYVSVWRGLFPVSGIDGIMRFAQGFAIPCLLFKAIAELDLGASFDPRLLVSFYTGATLCFFAGIFGARILFKRDWEDSLQSAFVAFSPTRCCWACPSLNARMAQTRSLATMPLSPFTRLFVTAWASPRWKSPAIAASLP